MSCLTSVPRSRLSSWASGKYSELSTVSAVLKSVDLSLKHSCEELNTHSLYCHIVFNTRRVLVYHAILPVA